MSVRLKKNILVLISVVIIGYLFNFTNNSPLADIILLNKDVRKQDYYEPPVPSSGTKHKLSAHFTRKQSEMTNYKLLKMQQRYNQAILA